MSTQGTCGHPQAFSGTLIALAILVPATLAGCAVDRGGPGSPEPAVSDAGGPAPQSEFVGSFHSRVYIWPIYRRAEEVRPGWYRYDLFGFTERICLYHHNNETHLVRLDGAFGGVYIGGPGFLTTYHRTIPWEPGAGNWVQYVEDRRDFGRPMSSVSYEVDHSEDGVLVGHIDREFFGPIYGPLRPEMPPPVPVPPPGVESEPTEPDPGGPISG